MSTFARQIVIRVVALVCVAAGSAATAQDRDKTPAKDLNVSDLVPAGSDRAETTKIAEGLYTFSYYAARNIFVVTPDGVIVTDPLNPEAAGLLRAEIRKVTPLPVKYVIYSHQHWDHARGGKIFKDEGATFISHINCVKHFQQHPNPDIVMPDIAYEGSRYDLKLGGRTLELLYFGRNHGDCMTFVRLPEERILYIVDLVTPYGVSGGSGLLNDYYPKDWIRTLLEIENTVDFDRMIGGHGVPIAPKSAVTERRRYLEAMFAAVKAEFEKGTNPFEIAERIDLPEFRYLRNYDALHARNAERFVAYFALGW
jgi:glyoxylase-like metal-dependent hydrolase (beta-lactamase superfamily II)